LLKVDLVVVSEHLLQLVEVELEVDHLKELVLPSIQVVMEHQD
jgi:hypothetical protein